MKKTLSAITITSLFILQAPIALAKDEVKKAAPVFATPPPVPIKRSVTKLADGVYRLQNNFHYSMVVVTDNGVVVTDPINADAAKWIKSEIAKLTSKPITHLIYSHSHGDHASGGALLAENATVIAQRNAPESIDSVEPTMRFDSELSFKQGNKTFELTWLGVGHGQDLIAVVVRPENVAFITDVAAPKRLPWRNMGGANIDDWISQVKKVNSLDFDIFAPAHGNVGVKSDTQDVITYMEMHKSSVKDGLNAGKTVDQLKKELTMDEYKDWIRYDDWRPLNIEGMADFLKKTGQVS